jgi:hypothetical protein
MSRYTNRSANSVSYASSGYGRLYPFQHITRNESTQNATSHSLPKYRKISNVSEGAVERKEARYPHGRRRKREEAEEEWGSAAGTVSFRGGF